MILKLFDYVENLAIESLRKVPRYYSANSFFKDTKANIEYVDIIDPGGSIVLNVWMLTIGSHYNPVNSPFNDSKANTDSRIDPGGIIVPKL
jgi:hypothetical protein